MKSAWSRCFKPVIIPILSLLMIVVSCDGDSHVDPHNPAVPWNTWIEINEGSAATNDTSLSVGIGAEGADFMQLGENADLVGVTWIPFDTLLSYQAPRREGSFALYCRFASVIGGTTDVISDDINLDFSAVINSVEVFAFNDTLYAGDQIEFTVNTGEPGNAKVSFGDVIVGYHLNWDGNESFRRLLMLPEGILNQRVSAVAKFTDVVGNVADSLIGEQSFVLSGPDFNPRIVSVTEIPSYSLVDIWYCGGYCFISDWDRAVHIIDVNHAERPVYYSSIRTADWTQGMDGNGEILVAADCHGGLVVIRVSPPELAEVIGREPLGGLPKDVVVNGDFAYVATYTTGLRIVDISDPTDPVEISRHPTIANCFTICKEDSLVFIGGIGGFSIINVRDPYIPRLVGEFLFETELMSIVSFEQCIYAATVRFGVLAVDVSDPSQPELIAAHAHLDDAYNLTKKFPFLFVNQGDHISVVNISNPSTLPLIRNIRDVRAVFGGFATDQYLYIIGSSHLTIVETFPH